MNTPLTTLAAAGPLVIGMIGVAVFIASIIFQKKQEAEAKAKRQSGLGGPAQVPRADTSSGGLSPGELEAARRRREELRARIQRLAETGSDGRQPSSERTAVGGSDLDQAREKYRQRAEQTRRETDAMTRQQSVSTGDRMRADATENARAASAAHDKAEAQTKLRAAAERERLRAEETARQKAAAAPTVAGAAEPQPQSLLDSRQKKQVKPAPAAGKPVRAFSLKQAMIWKEILDPPVSMRE